MVAEALVVVVALLAIRDARVGDFFMDTDYFATAGYRLLSSGWLDTFDKADLQIGPVAGLLYGVVARVMTEVLVLSGHGIFSVLIELGYCAGVVGVARALRVGPAKELSWVDAILVLWVAAMGLPWTAFFTGHFMEGAIPLLWILAAKSATDDRPELAGMWLLLSFGLKAWGGLGLALLLLTPRLRRSWRAALIFGVGAVAIYLPFFVWGSVETFSFRWRVLTPGPLVAWFLDPGATVGWGLRVAQGALVLIVGCAIAIWARRRPSAHTPWVVPLVVVVARLFTDPVGYWYYWLAAQTIAVVGIRTVVGERRLAESSTWVIAIALYMTIAAPPVLAGAAALVAGGVAMRRAIANASDRVAIASAAL